MRIRLRHLSWVVFFCLTVDSFAGQYFTSFLELHGEFLGNLKYAENGTKLNQFGLGVNANIGFEYFQAVLEYDYRRVNMTGLAIPNLENLSIHEFYGGLRYFPMHPTFSVGSIAVRLTAGAMAGIDLEPNFRTLLFCGLAFTPITSLSGLTIDFVYRPGAHCAGGEMGVFKGYLLEPCWMIRAGITLGPSLQ